MDKIFIELIFYIINRFATSDSMQVPDVLTQAFLYEKCNVSKCKKRVFDINSQFKFQTFSSISKFWLNIEL